MRTDKSGLEAVRNRIDQIDAKLHSLIVHRCREAFAVERLKPPDRLASPLRPERERKMFERLLNRHAREKIPNFLVLESLWRTLITVSSQIQRPFDVFVGSESRACWDLARFQFGFAAPLIACADGLTACERARTSPRAIAMVPLDDGSPWWRCCANDESWQVFARAPMFDFQCTAFGCKALLLGPIDASQVSATHDVYTRNRELGEVSERDHPQLPDRNGIRIVPRGGDEPDTKAQGARWLGSFAVPDVETAPVS